MVNAQEWLDKKYTEEKRREVKLLVIDGRDLEGELKLEGFSNLEMVECFKNKITNLAVINCPKIRHLNISCNLFETFDFLNNLDHEKLVFLSVHSNNFPKQDLSIFSKFTNLEELYAGNSDEEKIENGIYNRFSGSLVFLKNLNKLRFLSISNTDINSGIEYLPESLKKISCRGDEGKECLEIKRLLEETKKFKGVTEELVKDEEGDTKWSRYWYRLAPWRQFQDLLLEEKPLVQKLREQLTTKEKIIFDLEERLKKEQSQYAELREQLVLAIKEKEIDTLKERIKSLESLLVSQSSSSISVGHMIVGDNATFNNYQIQYITTLKIIDHLF